MELIVKYWKILEKHAKYWKMGNLYRKLREQLGGTVMQESQLK